MKILLFGLALVCAVVHGAENPDVAVAVPGQLAPLGTLLVRGTPHHAENPAYSLLTYYCTGDSSGHLMEHGCTLVNEFNYKIGQPILLAPGTYMLKYLSSVTFAKVVAGQQTTLQLQEVRAGTPAQPNIHFKVFVDLTDSAMQDLYLRTY